MRYLIICLLLAGCSTFGSRPEWPKPPEVGQCEALLDAQQNEHLSALLSTVAANYGKYHECSARVEAWQSWYEKQKKIYEESK